jgi:DNA-binding LytR/AlgR family response regulator
MDERLKRLVDYIRQFSFSLKGINNNEIYNIPLENILYIDSVDGKTFLYCKRAVYESKETLASLEQTLMYSPFVRISKNCILNISALKSVRSTLNHKMEATLLNGEKLVVNRNYIDLLKSKLEL